MPALQSSASKLETGRLPFQQHPVLSLPLPMPLRLRNGTSPLPARTIRSASPLRSFLAIPLRPRLHTPLPPLPAPRAGPMTLLSHRQRPQRLVMMASLRFTTVTAAEVVVDMLEGSVDLSEVADVAVTVANSVVNSVVVDVVAETFPGHLEVALVEVRLEVSLHEVEHFSSTFLGHAHGKLGLLQTWREGCGQKISKSIVSFGASTWDGINQLKSMCAA